MALYSTDTTTLSYEEWRLTHPPIMGGAPEGDEGEGQEDSDTDQSNQPDPLPKEDQQDDSEDDGAEPDSVEARLAVLQKENQRLKREQAAMAKERRKAEAEARARDERRREEQGQYKELATERAKEIESLKAQIAERDRQDRERAQRTRVTAIADKLNYRNPNLAFPVLMDSLGPEEAADTLEDDTLIEAALKRLARDQEFLVDKQRRSGAPVGRNGQGGKPDPNRDLAQTILALTGNG